MSEHSFAVQGLSRYKGQTRQGAVSSGIASLLCDQGEPRLLLPKQKASRMHTLAGGVESRKPTIHRLPGTNFERGTK